jgi:signal transduction histidine kinase
VKLETEGSHVVAKVGDDGPGIPADERDRIFDRYYRLQKTPGSGLGLSLVAAAAELHEMKLTVGTNSPGLQMIMTFAPTDGRGRSATEAGSA